MSNVKLVLTKLGFENVWLAQGVEHKQFFLTLLKQRIRDLWLIDFNNRLENSTRALFYRTIVSFNFSKYLDVITIRKYSIALSRLRVSSHRLAVESGRWRKPVRVPVEERICPFCNVLEDEYHFVLECIMLKDLRVMYIKKYYWNHPSNFKFVALMTTENVSDIRNLSVFTYKAFIQRQQLLA